jgi:acyl-CoA thioesterase
MAAAASRKLARACADFLWAQDATLRGLGLERLSIGPGQAIIAMTVQPAMVNGIGITHGGAIFTLADTAFSLAANSYNERTVAAYCSIAFLHPNRLGDRLVATAREVVRSARSGIYDIRVMFAGPRDRGVPCPFPCRRRRSVVASDGRPGRERSRILNQRCADRSATGSDRPHFVFSRAEVL